MAGHEIVECPHGVVLRRCRCLGPHPTKVEPCPTPDLHKGRLTFAGWNADGTEKLPMAVGVLPEREADSPGLEVTDLGPAYAALEEGMQKIEAGMVTIHTDRQGVPHIHPDPDGGGCTEACLGWYARKVEKAADEVVASLGEPGGTWMAYHQDSNGFAGVVPFDDELLAWRHAGPEGKKVKFVPFGTEL